jgi:dienelactone hydrolase
MRSTGLSAIFPYLCGVALLACGTANEATSGGGGAGAASAGTNAGGGGADAGSSGAYVAGASGHDAVASAGGGSASTGGSTSSLGGAGAGGSGGVAGADTVGGSAGSPAGGAGGTGSTLPPVSDYSKPGPFTTTIDMKVGPDAGYTVYRPSTLGENGFKHSPIIFGPGIGQSVSVHTAMLTNFASHGFVVVGTPVLNGGPGAPGNLALMQAGLDWILAQNEAQGSVFQGKLDVKHAVSMGYSVGGTSAVQLGGHPAVATTVSIHGHTAMSAMHGPLLQTTGTKDTVGMPLQQSTYGTSQVQTFLATLTGADHGYIQNAGGGEERPAIVAWLRYWLNGDQGAKHYFYGDDCVLCQAPWENPQRKNWQ